MRYQAFVASRGSEEAQKKGAQIWLLHRRGGEPRKVSDVKGGVSGIQWSPDNAHRLCHRRRRPGRRPREEGRLGLPKVSYPFFHADRIKTSTLFMGGNKDFNVPIAGSEQMYQALRSLGVPTELVIHPGRFHSLTVPSYQRDRLQRYPDWFNQYLQPASTTSPGR